VIGTSTNCHGTILHAFLWDNGSLIDLSSQVLPGSGFSFVEPVVINDRGEIEGNAFLPTGDMHAVVLKPDGDDSSPANVPAAFDNPASATAQAASKSMTAMRERGASTPLERVQIQMRQRYHLPGQPAAPRD
jgi:probable HAF family extracellular repeat protein